MAKSIRSKVKRSFRMKKRETGVYAASEAARLNRLNSKLQQITTNDSEGDAIIKDVEDEDSLESREQDVSIHLSHPEGADSVPADGVKPVSQHVSTHGPRGSRREEWRKSKGISVRPPPKGMNRQGGLAARRKAGRSRRRR